MKNNVFIIWAVNIALGIDCLVNAIFGGDYRETISSRLGKSRIGNSGKTFAYFICRILHFLDPNHCENSVNDKVGDRAPDIPVVGSMVFMLITYVAIRIALIYFIG
jgi:hypothetical protein